MFVTKGLNQALARGSRRAALGQWWTLNSLQSPGVTALPGVISAVASDGTDVWVADGGLISRVHGSDGRLLESWTSSGKCISALLVAMGRVFATDCNSLELSMLDPSQPAGSLIPVATLAGSFIPSLAFDGVNLWVVADTTLSTVTPGPTLPWTMTTLKPGVAVEFLLFDGVSMWGTSSNGTTGTLVRLDTTGAVVQTVPVGNNPWQPIFDGANIWIPDSVDNTLTVVQATTGTVLSVLSGNGMSPHAVAFDGQRILVTGSAGNLVSLWRAADLAPLGSYLFPGVGPDYLPVCSDGLNFWIGGGGLVRF